MIRIEYIEDRGQTYSQCVSEISKIRYIDFSYTQKNREFFVIINTDVALSMIPSRNSFLAERKHHAFKFSVN